MYDQSIGTTHTDSKDTSKFPRKGAERVVGSTL